MKEKSNKGLQIAIGLIGIVLLGGVGFISFKLGEGLANVQDGIVENAKEESSSKIAVTKDEIESIMDIIDFNPDEVTNVDEFNALDNQLKLKLGFNLVDRSEEKFKGSDVIVALKNIYGDGVKLILEDTLCDRCGKKYWVYNKGTDLYTLNGIHLYGDGGLYAAIYDRVNYYFESIERVGNQYKVVVKKVFDVPVNVCDYLGPCDEDIRVYKDSEEINLVLDTTVGDNNEKYCVREEVGDSDTYTASCDIDKIYEDYRDKFNSYTYTFIKDGDNFVFQSYELNK